MEQLFSTKLLISFEKMNEVLLWHLYFAVNKFHDFTNLIIYHPPFITATIYTFYSFIFSSSLYYYRELIIPMASQSVEPTP